LGKKVVISAGPIPGKLDSVKIVTNKFKGGLAIKTAEELSETYGFDVELVVWEGTKVDSKSDMKITRIGDIFEYYSCMKDVEADAYILAAAVANLIPASPWEGKFPSHNYKVGEEFDIKFTIAPRIIDMIKKAHPRTTLIGYKLFDGTEEELIEAGWETLCNSKSNVVFCNHPKTAKLEKIALMTDGTRKKMSFDEHIEFIARVINLQWYSTRLEGSPVSISSHIMNQILKQIGIKYPPYIFGTVAIRNDKGFTTTARGKKVVGDYCRVYSVNHEKREVVSSSKATLNAPFIEKLFALHPNVNCIVHGHRVVEAPTFPYSFSGTMEETSLADTIVGNRIFNVDAHGYYALFKNAEEALEWVNE